MSRGRVLIVDDSDLTRALLARLLDRAGFTVLQARDGAWGAVAALREEPDAVVTDLEMPTMDGYQLARLIKGDPATAHIPVLILTSHVEASSRFWGRQTGADAYLVKDDVQEQLIELVEKLMKEAPDPSGEIGRPPRTPLEVLARLARHLDANLLETTLIKTLLERGVQEAGLHETARSLLATLAEVTDAQAMGVAIADGSSVQVHIHLVEPAAESEAERAALAMIDHLGVEGKPDVELETSGELAAADDLFNLEMATYLTIPVRDAEGCLLVLPRDADSYRSNSERLLGKVLGHAALVIDNARLAERLRELSMVDGLTRLLNHRSIHERLKAEHDRSIRHERPLSVILADIDHFKLVNDSRGHLVGDAVLRAVAAELKRTLRSIDAVGRYGGEEFLTILPDTDLPEGRRVAERLRQGLETLVIEVDGEPVEVTASFGVAVLDELSSASPTEALVSLADQRLYAAKRAGRNRVCAEG